MSASDPSARAEAPEPTAGNTVPEQRPAPPAAPDPGWPGWLERRRERIRAEIERNRRGGHTVPTWVLALILVAFVAAWAAVVWLA